MPVNESMAIKIDGEWSAIVPRFSDSARRREPAQTSNFAVIAYFSSKTVPANILPFPLLAIEDLFFSEESRSTTRQAPLAKLRNSHSLSHCYLSLHESEYPTLNLMFAPSDIALLIYALDY